MCALATKSTLDRIWKIISFIGEDARTSLLSSLTELVNHLANGHIPSGLRAFLYGAQFRRLCKSNRGLRPIAVGCTYRRLAAQVRDPSSRGSISCSCPPKLRWTLPWVMKPQSKTPVFLMNELHSETVLLKFKCLKEDSPKQCRPGAQRGQFSWKGNKLLMASRDVV